MRQIVLGLFYLLLAFLPIDGYLLLEFGLPSPSIFIALILIIAYAVDKKFVLNVSKPQLYICVILISGLVLSVFGLNFMNSLNRIITLFFYLYIYIVIYSVVKNYRINYRNVLLCYSIPLLVICFITFANGAEFRESSRFSYATDYNPTWLAAHLVVIIFFCFKYIEDGLGVLLPIALGLISFYFIVMTQGRLALLTLIGSSLVVIVYFYFKNSGKSMTIPFMMVVLLGIVVFTNYDYLINEVFAEQTRIQRTLDFNEDYDITGATANRDLALLNYIKYVVDNNFIPVGIGNAGIATGSVTPHNMYMRLLVEMSFIGLILYILFIYQYINNSQFSTSYIISLYLVVSSLGNDMFYYKYFFIILYAYAIINDRKYDR